MTDTILYNSHNLAISIKTLAKTKNISLKTMLSDIGIGSNTMSALYHGKSIAFDSLAKIADYLDCSVDYLLGRTDVLEIQSISSPDNIAERALDELLILRLGKLTEDELVQVDAFVQELLEKR